MATERFPRAKYLRQLLEMQHELQTWKRTYREAAATHPDDWLGTKFAERGVVLEEAIDQVAQLHETLYGLPRLS